MLGSVYGSARPERDFPALLDLYRRGRPAARPAGRRAAAARSGRGGVRGSCATAAPAASCSTSTEQRHERAHGRAAVGRTGHGRRPDRGRRGPPLRGHPRPAVSGGVGPDPARDGGGDARHRALQDGVAGYASGDDVPDAALLERLLIGVDPMRTEAVREIFETVDFHGGRPWTVEVAIWDLVGAAARPAAVAAARRALGAAARVRVDAASPWRPRSARGASTALRDRGVRAVKLRFHHDDWRRDVEVVEQVRAAVGPATSRSWSTPTRAGAWPATAPRAGTSRPRRSAPARSSRSASTGSRSRCATDDVEGYALLRRRTSLRIAAGEMVRSLFEARDLILRGGVDVVQPDVGARRRPRRLPADRGARRPVRPGVLAAHVDERLRPAREPAPRGAPSRPARTSRCRSTRPDGRRTGATGCSAAPRSRSRRTGRSRPCPAPASGVVPDLDAPRGAPSRLMEIRAAVLHEARTPLRVETRHARPAARGRGARARRGGGRVPLGRPPRRRRPRRRALADGARARGRGRRRGGRRGRRRGLAPGDRSRSASSRRAGRVPRARRGGSTSARSPGRTRGRARCSTARRGCASPTAATSGTSTSSRASPSAASCRPRAPCRSRPSCRCGRRRCSAAPSSPGSARSATPRGSRWARACASIGCGGIGQQIVAAARMAGAGPHRRGRPRRREARPRPRRGATDTVDASAGDPVAAVLALVPGGVDHALEAVGRRRRSGSHGTCCAPARRRSWSASRRAAPRRACRRSNCSPRRRCGAATTARATRRSEIARLGRLMADGRIDGRRRRLAPHRPRRASRRRSGACAGAAARGRSPCIDAAIAGAPERTVLGAAESAA